MITQDELKELLHYNEKTGVFTWVGCSQSWRNGRIAGCLHKESGYVRISHKGITFLAHRLAWLYVHGYFPENGLDHFNRIRHKNNIENLREASATCNMRNRKENDNNTSGTKGITLQAGKWLAQICVDGKRVYLGYYTDYVEAVAHRLCAEQFVEWEGCDSSSPAFLYMQNYLRG